MKKAQQLLKEIKINNVSYAIMDENNEIYCNKETNNIMDIYGYDSENSHFYGVYSDIFGGKIDSRYFFDDDILNAIDKLLNLGDPVKRTETINKFKSDNKPLLMTIGTGAYGLNLQFCNKIAFASIAFDYGKIDQAKSRIRRLGQERDIEYTYFTSDLGIYTMIQENNQRKLDLKELIIDKIKKGERFENSI